MGQKISLLILIDTLAGFFLTPYLVGRYLPELVQEKLKKNAAIGEVRVNPYMFTFEANDFRMTEPDGRSIVGFKRLFIDSLCPLRALATARSGREKNKN